MNTSIQNCMVAQSGGPTVAINASLAGVIKGAAGCYGTVYGSVNGILGILNEHYLNLSEIMEADENALERLIHTPAMYLGSCRFKLPDFMDDDSSYNYIFKQFEKLNIGAFFYIGGNDSMDTVKMLSDYASMHGRKQRFIGVPKTIDNDLPITDHCPGYGSAAKYIATSLKEIIRDNAVYGDYRTSILVAEIMGRNAGWLTAATALAKDSSCEGVDAIYLPEVDFDIDAFLEKVKELAAKKKSIVIAVSEGIHLADGRFICEIDSHGNDSAGNAEMAQEKRDLPRRNESGVLLQRRHLHG